MAMLPPPPKPWPGMPDAWVRWMDKLRTFTSGSSVLFTALDFTGSDITSILTRLHNSLQSIQGGSAGDYNHLTTAQVALVTGAIQDPGSNGLIARTAAATYATRTLTGPAAGITVSNGNGVGGNPTLALADDLAALEGLNTTGFAKRTGSNAWSLDTSVVTGPGSSTDLAIAKWNSTGGTALLNTGITISSSNQLNLAAGGTGAAPVLFQSGTNLTTPTAGAMEYDGVVFYGTHAANERGVVDTEQFISLTSTYTLTSQTPLQKAFNSSTNGAVTLASSTSYFFEGLYTLSSLSGSSGYVTTGFGGTATLTSLTYNVISSKNGAIGTIGNCQNATFTVATASQATNATTNTSAQIHLQGIVRINAGGTFIPQVGMSVAAASVMGVNSYFRIWPVGTNTVTTLGNWS